MAHLTHLSLSSSPAGPGLQHLARLSSLGSLVLRDCGQVMDEHLQHLGGLRGLTSLSLSKSSVTGSNLGALHSLQRLRLYECSSVGPAALEGIAQLTRLTYLSALDSCDRATPAQLAQLSRLTNLQHLALGRATIRGGAAALLDLPKLAKLAAYTIAADQQQLAGRASCLGRLALVCPSAADLRALPQLPALQSLAISNAPAGIACLSALTQLTELVVGCISKDTSAADLARALQGLRQLQVLELHGVGYFDEQYLLAVAAMQQLRDLWLDGASGDGGGAARERPQRAAPLQRPAAAHPAALRAPAQHTHPGCAGEPAGHAAGGAEGRGGPAGCRAAGGDSAVGVQVWVRVQGGRGGHQV
jgi:hypothetical protein